MKEGNLSKSKVSKRLLFGLTASLIFTGCNQTNKKIDASSDNQKKIESSIDNTKVKNPEKHRYEMVKGDVDNGFTVRTNTKLGNSKKQTKTSSKKNVQNVSIRDYHGCSIVDALASIGYDSSFKSRAKLAKKYGIKNYKGTARQNTKLLKKLKKDNFGNKKKSSSKKKKDKKETKKDLISVIVPIVTPEPTKKPIPSETPKPTGTPVPSATIRPIRTQAPVETAKPTGTPVPSATIRPIRTQAPVETAKPTGTPAPSVTATPIRTQAPVETAKPTGTPAPSVTATPIRTQAPVETAKPTGTPVPSVTATPIRTQAPVETAKPTGTPAPSVTATPIVTSTPEVTATPEVTSTPEVTATPEVTSTPTIEPTITPEPCPHGTFDKIDKTAGDAEYCYHLSYVCNSCGETISMDSEINKHHFEEVKDLYDWYMQCTNKDCRYTVDLPLTLEDLIVQSSLQINPKNLASPTSGTNFSSRFSKAAKTYIKRK